MNVYTIALKDTNHPLSLIVERVTILANSTSRAFDKAALRLSQKYDLAEGRKSNPCLARYVLLEDLPEARA